MRKPKLIEDYSKLLYDAVSPFAHSVARQTGTSLFITGGVALVKPLVDLVEALDEDVATTDHPTPAQTAQRDGRRTAVVTELGRIAKRLNLDYPGNEAALLSSGLTMAEAPGAVPLAQRVGGTDSIIEVEILDGTQAGCLLLRFVNPPGRIQTLVRYTTDPKLPEEHWLVAVGGGRERQLGPFESGTRVYVKAAALTGSTTEPQYSAVKSRIVQ